MRLLSRSTHEPARLSLNSRRRRARGAVRSTIARIPDYLRLFYGMMTDPRVSRLDRALVLGAIAYVVSPFDFVPDFIPFLGQVDDVFLIMLALTRLFDGARRRVVLDNWPGTPDELSPRALRRLLYAASLFLPPQTRRRLRRMTAA